MSHSLNLTAQGIRGINFRAAGWGHMRGFHGFSGLAVVWCCGHRSDGLPAGALGARESHARDSNA